MIKFWFLIVLVGISTGVFAQIKVGYTEKGVASYYEERFDGRKTASGEKFDNSELVASHRKIPFNTKVKVTNLENKQWVIVRINDRGPYAHGRIIDVSLTAARKLDLISTAIARVELEVLSPEGKTLAEIKAAEEKKKEAEENETPLTTSNKPVQVNLQDSDFLMGKTYNHWGSLKKPEGVGIQIASFDNFMKVQAFLKRFEKQDIGDIFIQVGVNSLTKKKTFRVLINEYADKSAAEKDFDKVKQLTKLTNNFTLQAHYK